MHALLAVAITDGAFDGFPLLLAQVLVHLSLVFEARLALVAEVAVSGVRPIFGKSTSVGIISSRLYQSLELNW